MRKSRKKESGLAVLLRSPWWISVLIGLLVYACLHWLIPGMFAGNPYLSTLAQLSHNIAWLALPAFGIIASFAFLNAPRPERDKSEIGKQSPAAKRGTIHLATGDEQNWGQHPTPHPVRTDSKSGLPAWSMEALRSLEWKRFELLCAKYYETLGFKSVTLSKGADGGIDIKLYRTDPEHPIAIVQCKAWANKPVGVKEVRELLGVMAHEKVARGIFLSSSTYSKDAIAFAASNPIQLLDGSQFLARILQLEPAQQHALNKFAFDGDYSTPSCASCGIKMVMRHSEKGSFWGCLHYPRCRSKIYVRSTLHSTG
ncbi:DNA topoisomerase I/SWI domain fusion protein [compost metagenome]